MEEGSGGFSTYKVEGEMMELINGMRLVYFHGVAGGRYRKGEEQCV